jgi:zinc protease
MAIARRTYGVIPANGEIGPRLRPQEPEPMAERRVILRDERAGRASIQRQYIAPSYTTAAPREAEALELLSRIVGSSNTSRLYQRLVVEEKKAASASGWYIGGALDSGLMGFYAIAAGDASLDEIEALMDAVFADVIANGVTQAELDRARNAAIADIVYNADNQASLARTYGWALATGRTVADVESREARLKAVTLEDIRAAAAKYLQSKRSVTGLLIPVPSEKAARSAAPPPPGGTIH